MSGEQGKDRGIDSVDLIMSVIQIVWMAGVSIVLIRVFGLSKFVGLALGIPVGLISFWAGLLIVMGIISLKMPE